MCPRTARTTDAGATASDASYASDLTVTGANSDFDITKVGNYTFTYTAEDEAGNTAYEHPSCYGTEIFPQLALTHLKLIVTIPILYTQR